MPRPLSTQPYDDLIKAAKEKKEGPIEAYLSTGTSEERSAKLTAVLREGYTRITTVLGRDDKSGQEEMTLNRRLFLKAIDIAEKQGILLRDKDSTDIIDRMVRDLDSFIAAKNDTSSEEHPLYKMATKFLAFQETHRITGDLEVETKKAFSGPNPQKPPVDAKLKPKNKSNHL